MNAPNVQLAKKAALLRRISWAALLVGPALLATPDPAAARSGYTTPSPRDFALTRTHVHAPRHTSFRFHGESEFHAQSPFSQNLVPGFVSGYSSHLQLMLQMVVVREEGTTFVDGYAAEMGMAPGAYGEVPLNPALFLGLDVEGLDPSSLRGSLQLSEVFKKYWLAAANLSVEQTIGDWREREFLLYSGLRRQGVLEGLDLGGEFKGAYALNGETGNGDGHELLFGPSAVWQAGSGLSLQVNSLFGLSGGSPRNETNLTLVYTGRL